MPKPITARAYLTPLIGAPAGANARLRVTARAHDPALRAIAPGFDGFEEISFGARPLAYTGTILDEEPRGGSYLFDQHAAEALVDLATYRGATFELEVRNRGRRLLTLPVEVEMLPAFDGPDVPRADIRDFRLQGIRDGEILFTYVPTGPRHEVARHVGLAGAPDRLRVVITPLPARPIPPGASWPTGISGSIPLGDLPKEPAAIELVRAPGEPLGVFDRLGRRIS
jgi:hypothetical protein